MLVVIKLNPSKEEKYSSYYFEWSNSKEEKLNSKLRKNPIKSEISIEISPFESFYRIHGPSIRLYCYDSSQDLTPIFLFSLNSVDEFKFEKLYKDLKFNVRLSNYIDSLERLKFFFLIERFGLYYYNPITYSDKVDDIYSIPKIYSFLFKMPFNYQVWYSSLRDIYYEEEYYPEKVSYEKLISIISNFPKDLYVKFEYKWILHMIVDFSSQKENSVIVKELYLSKDLKKII